jgi:hypothetical protein
MPQTYTRFNISESTLFWGFGVELGFVDCAVDTMEKLIAEVDKLTDEQFAKAMRTLEEL